MGLPGSVWEPEIECRRPQPSVGCVPEVSESLVWDLENELIEDNLRDLQDNIKHYNIRIIGVPEDKKKDHEKILEEIIVENF